MTPVFLRQCAEITSEIAEQGANQLKEIQNQKTAIMQLMKMAL